MGMRPHALLRRHLVCILLGVLAALPGVLIGKIAWQADDPAWRQAVRVYGGDAPAPRILLLGDSVIFTAGSCDQDRRGLGEFIAARLGEPVQTLAHPAHTPLVQQAQIRFLAHARQRPEFLLIPLNLRWLSVHWGDNPDYQFTQRRLWLALVDGDWPPFSTWPAILRTTFGDQAESARRSWEKRRVQSDWGEPLGTVGELERDLPARNLDCAAAPPDPIEARQMRRQYTYHYATPPRHLAEMLDAVAQLRQRAQVLGLQPIFYFTPIDYEAIRRDGDPRVLAALEHRKTLLRTAIGDAGIPVFDFSQRLGHAHFIDRRYACEHLGEHGRQALAEMIAHELERLRSTAR